MLFILQKEDVEITDIDVFTLRSILNKQKYQHEYIYLALNDLLNSNILKSIKYIKEAIPVGTIDFVQAYLDAVYNINYMNPIEVPDELRLDRYLNRGYAVVDKSELPSKGYYFVKYASKLKEFSCTCDIESIPKEPNKLLPKLTHYLKDGLYVLSEPVQILSEYRCFILRDKVIGIQFYDGDCMVMPSETDLNKLDEMVMRYSINPHRPQAYTLDIALVKDKGLSILECHPFSSVGLYGLSDSSLPICYRLGIDWYIQENIKLKKYNNFKILH